ncbi:MAG: EscU/YscU/HrcU family type III secretion system export apparatus switch protein [Halanaerobiaceae bacterium]
MSEKENKPIKKAAALKYDHNNDRAPKIVAKGEGQLAEKIIKKAAEEDIPLRENKDIIDVLLKLNIGEEIPRELYQVIAEILSFIYQLEEK